MAMACIITISYQEPPVYSVWNKKIPSVISNEPILNQFFNPLCIIGFQAEFPMNGMNNIFYIM